ncbi:MULTISPECIES: hypothetical protein [unclassified Duganella]|uniref:hypothetical protein n=1 Tax=unclassified Duganella TaxID=2636909 RepID=UPI000E351017|nr:MULTISPECIES: hypothetical protein [unclassified Duganella]RFP10218.1 hypothetical protein D0T23_23450 [Duganella sp. BJB475]RFP25795.1 hypothetical protein D0T21_27160 [Duganella sp. BJB476]
MKTTFRPLCLAAAGALILIATACHGTPPVKPDAASLWQKIQAQNADTGCDRDSQCHTIAVGAKACGGPERYIAWSDRAQDGAQLKQLVAQHAAARVEEDKRGHMLSNCMLAVDTGAVCRAGRCVLNVGTAQP